MLLIRRFKKDEVLKIVAEYASRSLPEEKQGVIESRETKDGGVEVYFIEEDREKSIN